MDILLVVLLMLAAFILGGCPFSVWLGMLTMSMDIRRYGDGNPGSYNVFKAGSKKWGVVALILDIIKGIPFILIGKLAFGLGQPVLYLIAFSAVMGHAYSPFLGFRGGKALAVFAGSLLGLSQWDIIISLIVLFLLGFLFIGNDAWTVVLGIVGSLIMLMVTRVEFWEMVFISCISVLFIIKQFNDLRSGNHPGRLIVWIRSRGKPV
ncbi:MAG: glycerol-3-phosphate acyltransferase [Dehalococcoidia bacterium]|nr:glycerol-3-phosphate acyltransferase [Dehalococcoidia bacterium]